MAFKGNVESFSLADVFQNLAMNQQTGTLRITPERNPHAEEKYVYFQDGHVRFLSGSSRAPLLPPEVFVARGMLSKSEFDAALLRQAETSETIVTCLSGMGYVNEQQVQDLLVHQIEEEIYDLFGWEAASFEFNEGPPPEGLFAAEAAETGWGISIQISHLIMEAARRVDEWERLRKVIPSQKEIFVVDLTVRKAIERGEMETDPVEKRVAMLIDGARDVEDIVEDSKLFKFEVIGALSGFLQSSIIRPATLNELNFSEGECARLDLPKRRVKVLERILALGGENLRIRRELADLMAKMGQVEHACIHYSILASAEIKDAHEEGAIDIYKRILTIAPANVKTREALAALYAKRGLKRDAFVQYQELFENLRDQHLLREARDAAAHALENDPSNAKLRTALIELLLMEDKHEEAATQLELQGDIAAKSRNPGLAAEAYRRAMQYNKNIRPLKKKLNEVLLTKEDRLARRRRTMLSIFFCGIVLAAAGVLYYLENENQRAFDEARQTVAGLRARADDLNKQNDFSGAIETISTAIKAYAPSQKVWSPFKGIKMQADNAVLELKRVKEQLDYGWKSALEQRDTERSNLRIEAKACLDNFDYKGALSKFEKLLANPGETADERTQDTTDLDRVKKLIAEYKEGLTKITKLLADPAKAFKNPGEEMKYIDDFKKKYSLAKQDDFPKSLSFPLLVTLTNVDEVDVAMDATPIGTIRANASEQERVLRYPVYPVLSSHTFTFSKRGYTSQTESTAAHNDPMLVEAKVSLERKPVLVGQFAGIRFDGDARIFNDMLYAGTSEGELLEIDVKSDPPVITARFPLEQPLASVEKRVFGAIHIVKSGEKPPLFVYCTKGGYCAGLTMKDGKFEWAWGSQRPRVLDTTQPTLDFPPTYFTQGGKPKIALVTGTKIVVVDAETGATVPVVMDMPISAVNNKPVMATSGASFFEHSGIERDGEVLAVAGSDSNIHLFGFSSLGSKPKTHTWTTDLSKIAVNVRIPPVVVGNKVIVAGDNGTILFFKLSGNLEPMQKEAAGGIVTPPLVDNGKVYFACSGMTRKEGLSVIDMNSSDMTMRSRNDIAISLTPSASSKRVYFVTGAPETLYAIDIREINTVYWKYKIGRGVACPPVVTPTRVYVLTNEGKVIGFEEPR